MQRTTILFCLLTVAAVLLFQRCANPVSPQGGPKDTTPPRVLECDPPLYSTGVKKNSFQIDFDEFVTLKNPVSEVFISPPLMVPPDSRMRGKSLLVRFDDELDSNTTYSITFGNAITDLTEGNILRGFNYVFSTGTYVDSLSLQGTLVDAFDHMPKKGVFVELYMNNNDTLPFDSLPLKVPPYYLTKTDDNGNFFFHNLQNKKFMLFALADQNGDLVFNQPSEKIAFYDSLVTPYYIVKTPPDTTRKDTLEKPPAIAKTPEMAAKADSIRLADSLKKARLMYPSYPLFLYEETDSVQRLLKSTFVKEGMALFAFRFPVNEVTFVPLNFDSAAPWYLPEFSKRRDSLTLWITRPNTDSLVLKVIAGEKVLDTVSLELVRKESPKKAQNRPAEQLGIFNPLKSAGLNQFKNVMSLGFTAPVARWDFSRILLIDDKDTVHPGIRFGDSIRRTILIDHKWQEDRNYRIIIPDSVFYSITNLSHDSVKLSFKTRAERDFGNLVLNVASVKQPGRYIVQVLNDNESAVYDEKVIHQPGKIRFEYLPALKYRIKIIWDRNGNGHWDTGNFRTRLQPEEVIYLPKVVEIRANWDIEENLD